MALQGVSFTDTYPSQTQIFEKEFSLPPSINSYWKLNKQFGHLYVSTEGHQFRQEVRQVVGMDPPPVPLRCRLACDVILVPPDNRRRDVDNIQKCLLDALQKASVYLDDSQIDDIRIRRAAVDRAKGRILVRLYRLSEDLPESEIVEPPAPEMKPASSRRRLSQSA